ncbi:rhomboid family intramembrane serine protease [Aliikangiella sp. IMCC44632]
MKSIQQGLKILALFLAIIWAIELLNILTDRALNSFGLYPRRLDHWYGIFFAPLLHHDIAHIVGNSIPLFVLGVLVYQTGKFWQVTAMVFLASGVIVWLIGRPAFHIGASGVVLGYWGFLIANGLVNRSVRNLLLSIVTLLAYGGMLFSLMDFRQFISYESHIAGFICGVIAANRLKTQ